MRLWSIHPRYLDPKGLVALWREGLLAQKVLEGKTRGYRHHPQLIRFRETRDPVAAIGAYLRVVCEDAARRGYEFDETKIVAKGRGRAKIEVTRGQLEYERKHLRAKLEARAPKLVGQLKGAALDTHPLFRVIEGPVEEWEVVG